MYNLEDIGFLCDECDTEWSINELGVMLNVGATYDTLCCKTCDNDSLKIVVPKEDK